MSNADLARMLAYLDWANEATLTAAGALPPEVLTRDVGISFGSILGTLRHMQWAERLWFDRWASGADPAEYEAPVDLPSLDAAWRALADERRAWVAALPADAAASSIRFHHFRDGEQSAHLGDMVLHVVTHATMHRGQVIGMTRQAGITPPATGLRTFMAQGR